MWQRAMKKAVLSGFVATRESLSRMWQQIRRDARGDVARAIALVRAYEHLADFTIRNDYRNGKKSGRRRINDSSSWADRHERINRQRKL